MSRHPDRTSGDVVNDVLAVADLLREPQIAQLHAYLVREGTGTVRELGAALDLAPVTADNYVSRLVDRISSRRPTTRPSGTSPGRSPSR